jgi:hypothetical protein
MLTPADLLRLRMQNSPLQSIGSQQASPNLLGNVFDQPSAPVNPYQGPQEPVQQQDPYNQPPVEQNPYEDPTPEPDIQDDEPPDQISPEIIKALMGQYTPETRASDALQAGLENFPQREEPGKARRIMAAIAGAGYGVSAGATADGARLGFRGGATPAEKYQASEQVMYPDYGRKISDWQMKIKPLEVAAQNERLANQNERMNINNVASRMLTGERNDIMRFGAQSLDKYRTSETERKWSQQDIQWYKAYIQDYKTRHPNHIYKEDRQGNVIGIDPSDDKAYPVPDPLHPGKNLTQLPEELKVEMGIKGAMARTQANISAANARATQAGAKTVMIDGELYTANPREKEPTAKPVAGVPEGATVTNVPSGNQSNTWRPTSLEEGRAFVLTAKKLALDEELGKYVHVQGNDVQVDRPGWISGPTEEQYRRIGMMLKSAGGSESSGAAPKPIARPAKPTPGETPSKGEPSLEDYKAQARKILEDNNKQVTDATILAVVAQLKAKRAKK